MELGVRSDLQERNDGGVAQDEQGDQILPFVRCFYGSPSTCLWEDETGNVQDIPQGEGGEQGDPLMPLLFSLGLHGALNAVKARLSEGEKVVAFLDDVHVICVLKGCWTSTRFWKKKFSPTRTSGRKCGTAGV